MYLLCCILRIVKTKDLASTITATLFYPPEAFIPKSQATPNAYVREHSDIQAYQQQDLHSCGMQADAENSGTSLLNSSVSSQYDLPHYSSLQSNSCSCYLEVALHPVP